VLALAKDGFRKKLLTKKIFQKRAFAPKVDVGIGCPA